MKEYVSPVNPRCCRCRGGPCRDCCCSRAGRFCVNCHSSDAGVCLNAAVSRRSADGVDAVADSAVSSPESFLEELDITPSPPMRTE